MPTKAERDEEKRKVSEALRTAYEEVNNAKDAAGVDAAVAKANKAVDTALAMANAAIANALKPGHTSEEEDVEVELRDFLAEAQTAAQKVADNARKKKDATKW